MIRNRKLLTAAIVAIFVSTACQNAGNSTAVNSSSTSNAPAETAAVNSAPAASSPVNVAADSPTAAYVAAYNARKNKDIGALRSLLSRDIIEFFEIVAEEEKKSVDEMLRELADRPQADSPETRNEKIDGDKATIEYLDEKGIWQVMDLVKEDGKWKLTLALSEPESDAPPANKK